MAEIGFSGGKALEAKLREIAERAGRVDEVRVGFLEDATYPDGTPVAEIAAIQEYGAPDANIPSRPYFRRMIAEKSPNWGKSLGNLAVAHNYDSQKVMELMGQGIKGQLQRSINELTEPPLKPETVARKGFDKPLIDTGHMVNSVDYEVRKT